MKDGITIMTEPLSAYYKYRTVVRKYMRRIPNNYGGHYSVTRSLFDGFQAIGFQDYNYRPPKEDICGHVHVLSGIPALKYGIELKRKGMIKRLTAGPNTIGLADELGWEYLCDKEIDLILWPSQHVVDYYEKYIPELKGKMRPFASGVNENDFKPKEMKRDCILLYLKHVDPYWGDYISYVLKKHDFHPVVIQYGDYNLEEYKRLLNRSIFMISLSKGETQGLFLAEAWAMDCPTICWNVHFATNSRVTKTIFTGNRLGSPYVCNENGGVFDTIEQLEDILVDYKKGNIVWESRKWLLENMTDAVCSRNFLNLIQE